MYWIQNSSWKDRECGLGPHSLFEQRLIHKKNHLKATEVKTNSF